jgi:phospholipid/cholesterol/gamma-HCH transport system substrate-binding protein
MRSLTAPIIKSLIFIVITVLATIVLVSAISNNAVGSSGTGYSAAFTDATALNVGDDVRMAGVRIGNVTSVSVYVGANNKRLAKVGFEINSGVKLASTVHATIRFRNLVGQRYIELDQGAGSPENPWPSNEILPVTHTSPALDLTALFEGFRPLFSALSPHDVNELSYEIIQIFQGEGATVSDLVTRTATLTTTLADRDQLIGQVIDNLTKVLQTVNARRNGLSTTLITLQQLVSALAEDRASIGAAVTNLAGVTKSVAGLLKSGRPALKTSIESLGALSANLANNAPQVERFLRTLPAKLDHVGRLASYGSWINTYLCSITGRIPVPKGYYGGVGAQAVEARCQP